METLIILGLLGWGGYKLLRLNTAVGGETLRAYIYLESLLQGAPKNEAQALAAHDMLDLDIAVTRQIVTEIRTIHNGKQVPLLAEAYRRGMRSNLPSLFRSLAMLSNRTTSVSVVYTIPLSLKEQGYDAAPPDNHSQTQGGSPKAHSDKKAQAESAQERFKDYYNTFIQETRRLARTPVDKPHKYELIGDGPIRHAFFMGVNAHDLAQDLYQIELENTTGACKE